MFIYGVTNTFEYMPTKVHLKLKKMIITINNNNDNNEKKIVKNIGVNFPLSCFNEPDIVFKCVNKLFRCPLANRLVSSV